MKQEKIERNPKNKKNNSTMFKKKLKNTAADLRNNQNSENTIFKKMQQNLHSVFKKAKKV